MMWISNKRFQADERRGGKAIVVAKPWRHA